MLVGNWTGRSQGREQHWNLSPQVVKEHKEEGEAVPRTHWQGGESLLTHSKTLALDPQGASVHGTSRNPPSCHLVTSSPAFNLAETAAGTDRAGSRGLEKTRPMEISMELQRG